MLFLVAAFLLLGLLVGTAAHLPVSVTLAAGSAIAVWLVAFAVRERRRQHQGS